MPICSVVATWSLFGQAVPGRYVVELAGAPAALAGGRAGLESRIGGRTDPLPRSVAALARVPVGRPNLARANIFDHG